MPKLRRVCTALLVAFLLSQVAAQDPLWRLDVSRNEPHQNAPLIANDEMHVFYLQAGQVKAVDARMGKPSWAFHIGNGAQLRYGSGVLVAITGQGRIFALEPATGRVRWSRAEALAGIYAIANKTLYIAAVEKLSAVNLETGKVQWSNHVTLFSFSPFEPFTVAKKRIFVYSVGGDVVMFATTYIFDERTGKTLDRADTHGPLAIIKGRVLFQNDWIRLDKPDDVFINVHDLKTGKRLKELTYTVDNRNLPEGSYSGSEVRMDPKAIYISGGGNLACFPLASPKRTGKPDFIRVPHGDVAWVAGPHRETFVLEWENAVWLVQQEPKKPCLPIELPRQGLKLASGRVAQVTFAKNAMYIGLKNGTFYAVNLTSGQPVLRLEAHTAAFGPTRVLDDRLIIQAGDELRAFDLPPALKETGH